MKITNLSEQKPKTKWHVYDYFIVGDTQNVKQIVEMEDGSIVVFSTPHRNDFEAKKRWTNLSTFLQDFGSEYKMVKVKIKEIVVEEI